MFRDETASDLPVVFYRYLIQAVRAEISAMKNLNLVKEVREQKLAEGQEIGKLVLLAEAKLGELFNQMPKAMGTRTDLQPLPAAGKKLNESTDEAEPPAKPKPKLEVAADMGFNKNQVADFQKLAEEYIAAKAKERMEEDKKSIHEP